MHVHIIKCDGPNCRNEITAHKQFWPHSDWLHFQIVGSFMDPTNPSKYDFCSFLCARNLIQTWIPEQETKNDIPNTH